MNFKLMSTLTLASACCFSNVSADTFSYSYIEGGVADYIDEVDGPTFLIEGSYGFSSNFNFLADYSTTTIESQGSIDLDYDTFGIGIGYHRSMNEKSDFIASLKYVNVGISITEGFASAELADADGFSVGAGVRYKMTDKFEANLGLEHIKIEDASDTLALIGGRYYFNDKFSAALSYKSGDEDGIAGTVRYDFK